MTDVGKREHETRRPEARSFVDLLSYGYPADLDAEIAALEANLSKAHLPKQSTMQESLTRRTCLV